MNWGPEYAISRADVVYILDFHGDEMQSYVRLKRSLSSTSTTSTLPPKNMHQETKEVKERDVQVSCHVQHQLAQKGRLRFPSLGIAVRSASHQIVHDNVSVMDEVD